MKLGDLGIAKSIDEYQSLTMTGAAMGTPHYVSSEQAQGKKDFDLRADIYSLGSTLPSSGRDGQTLQKPRKP